MSITREENALLYDNLDKTPGQIRELLGYSPTWNVSTALRHRRKLASRTRYGELRSKVEPLIMQRGVTIDECAERFGVLPSCICRVMGWL